MNDVSFFSWRNFLFAAALALASSAPAAEPTPEQIQFFESKIRPLLAGRCYKCHSHEATKLKGGLSLEFRESVLKGGDTGPALIPGHPETSLLLKAVRYQDEDLKMPPKGEKLSDAEIADLVAGDARTSAVVSLGAQAKTPDDRGVVAEAFADYMEGICR